MSRPFPSLLKSRGLLLAGYLLLAWGTAVQQWSLIRPGDPYTHYNNYVIFRQSFVHLVRHLDIYTLYLLEQADYFRYSPSFALAFGAFAWMPDLPGLILWNTLNAAVLFLGWMALPFPTNSWRPPSGGPIRLSASARAARYGETSPKPGEGGKPDPTRGLPYEINVAAAWFAVIEVTTALQNAQSNVLIAGLLLLAFSFLERRRMALASLMIVIAAFTKLFGLVAFSLFLLYPEKKKFILYSALWGIVAGLLPLAVVPFAELVRLYESWWRLLSMDYLGSAGLSIMAWLKTWFHLDLPRSTVTLIGIALFCWPLMYIRRHRDFNFRLLVLCNVLIWVVIFNHKAESSTYVIAMCGVALWFLSQRMSGLNVALASLAFIFTSLSPTDLFPRSLKATLLVPYAVKAVPCILIWLKLTYDLTFGRREAR